MCRHFARVIGLGKDNVSISDPDPFHLVSCLHPSVSRERIYWTKSLIIGCAPAELRQIMNGVIDVINYSILDLPDLFPTSLHTIQWREPIFEMFNIVDGDVMKRRECQTLYLHNVLLPDYSSQ